MQAECDASGATKEPLWESTSSFPFTVNDEAVTNKLAAALTKQFGDFHNPDQAPLGGSEDFSILATEAPNKEGGKGVPYSYWSFGGIDPERYKELSDSDRTDQIPINHSAYFAPVIQPTLTTGVDALVVAALTFLQ